MGTASVPISIPALPAAVLICCGDLCSPFMAKELGQGFAKPTHVVFNNDGDRFRIAPNAATFPHLQFHREHAELAGSPHCPLKS